MYLCNDLAGNLPKARAVPREVAISVDHKESDDEARKLKEGTAAVGGGVLFTDV